MSNLSVTSPAAVRHSSVSHRPTIWAASLAVLVAQMSLTILAPLNEIIARDFGATASQLTWLTAAVFAPTALFELNFGVLGDIFGRKKLMVGGLAVVAAGVATGLFANNLVLISIAMALLGLGAAVLLPSTLASVAEFSPEEKERAHALSRWALAISLGAAISPLLSGIMAQQFGFGAAYLPILMVSVIALSVVSGMARESRSAEKRSMDWPGQILIVVGLLAFIFAIIQGVDAGFGSPLVIGAFIVAAIALPLFVLIELRSPNPMFQVRLLRIPAFAAASVAGVFGMLGFMGTAYALAIKLGPIAHAEPLMIALPFVLVQLVPLAIAKWLPSLVHKVSPRILLAAGLLVLAIGQAWFALLPDRVTELAPLAGPILLLGVGFIVMFTSLTAAAINSVEHRYIGMASGATSLVRETGQTLGSVVVAAIALTTAASLVQERIATAGLPPEAMAVVDEVNRAGGPLALANAPLPEPIGGVVGPLATAALEQGFDLGLYAMAACSVFAALVVLVVMRGGAAAKPITESEDATLDV